MSDCMVCVWGLGYLKFYLSVGHIVHIVRGVSFVSGIPLIFVLSFFLSFCGSI